MNLLDTHVLLWHERGDPRLGATARKEIDLAKSEQNAAVSVISFWEIAMLIQKRRLGFQFDLQPWRHNLAEIGVVEIPISGDIAARAGSLPNLHGDPADRLIIATALDGHQLITADRRILDWPSPLPRLNARA